AVRAEVVRTLQLAAVRAFVECLDLQRIVRTAVAAAMGRYFSLGDSHCGTCSSKIRVLRAALGEGPATHKCAPGSGPDHGGKARPIAHISAVASRATCP